MGGCRCTFRNCTVNTMRYPGMHFFRYPLKQEERLQKWIEYANNHALLNLPKSQAQNKVVCALHFRDECFMNFKKDRLTPQAVPTLDRLRNGFVLDYTTSDNPKPTRLTPTTDQHLIPPKGYLPLGLVNQWPIDDFTNIQVLEEDDETECSDEPPVKRSKVIQTPTILNKDVYSAAIVQSGNGSCESDDLTAICLNEDAYDGDEYGFILSHGSSKSETLTEDVRNTENTVHTVNLDEIEFLTTKKPITGTPVHEQTLEEFEIDQNQYKDEWEKRINEVEAQKAHLEVALAETREELQDESRKASDAESCVDELRKKVKELEAINQTLRNTVPVKSRPAVPGQLTKAQLFNGIKKYLSASMTALVRMEMFGAPDRPWKADEKQVSVEVLRLGGGVYDYFSDEWRLRLPPKRTVEQWAEEGGEEEDEDL